MATISMKNLLESGVHFGHQTRRWDPRMAPYIYMARNGIHIIDLQQTVQMAKNCYENLRDFVKDGKTVMFVGTKKQARASIEREAKRCNMPYVSNRWLGGLLTNFQTVKKSIDRMVMLEELEEAGNLGKLAKTKKERLFLTREMKKLQKNLGGIKELERLPDALVVIDPKREHIAVTEAKKLGLKVFAVIDTNCNPELIDYAIPGNDDAIRAISLFLNIMSEAIIDGTGQEDADTGLSIVDDEEEGGEAPAAQAPAPAPAAEAPATEPEAAAPAEEAPAAEATTEEETQA